MEMRGKRHISHFRQRSGLSPKEKTYCLVYCDTLKHIVLSLKINNLFRRPLRKKKIKIKIHIKVEDVQTI